MDAQVIVRQILSRQEAIDRELAQLNGRLHELSEERSRLRITLTTLEKMIGVKASELPVLAQPGIFAGMSVIAAARRLLVASGVPLTTKDITNALERGGVDVDVKDFYNKVYLTLQGESQKHGSDLFYADKYWGLRRWLNAAGSSQQLVSGSHLVSGTQVCPKCGEIHDPRPHHIDVPKKSGAGA